MINYCIDLDEIRTEISRDIRKLKAMKKLHSRYDEMLRKIATELKNDSKVLQLVEDSYDTGSYIEEAITMKIRLKRDEKSRQNSLDKGVNNWNIQIGTLKSLLLCEATN